MDYIAFPLEHYILKDTLMYILLPLLASCLSSDGAENALPSDHWQPEWLLTKDHKLI